MLFRSWISLLGAHTLPFSYVPVNNIISRDGEAALLAGYPSIKVIAPLRFGVGDVTTKPFGPHPDFPDVYYIPRTSWGYPFSPYMRQLITSAVAGEGIWAHYIHPDDVFDPSRSQGLGWEDLLSGFQSMVRFVKRQYPWLRYVTVRQAYELLRRTGSAGVEYRWDGEDLLIASEPGMLFRLRLNDRRLGSVSGGRIVHEYNRPSEVILETTENATRVSFR